MKPNFWLKFANLSFFIYTTELQHELVNQKLIVECKAVFKFLNKLVCTRKKIHFYNKATKQLETIGPLPVRRFEAVALVIEPEVRHLLHAPFKKRLRQRKQESVVGHCVCRKSPEPHAADDPGAAPRGQQDLGRHVTHVHCDVHRRVTDP